MAEARSIFSTNQLKNSTTFLSKLASQQIKRIPLVILFLVFFSFCFSQQVDTLKKIDSVPAKKIDSLVKVEYSPRKAAIRSAILPGWGQVYNKKYWKVPIVYAALGITGYIFVDNIKTYKDLKFAYAAKYKASLPPPANDSTDYFKIDPRYQPIS